MRRNTFQLLPRHVCRRTSRIHQARPRFRETGNSIMAVPDAARQKLRETFEGRTLDKQLSGWDELWKQEVTPWDRAGPSQALADAITGNADILGAPIKNDPSKQRKRALVPGCGRGYDVLLLASLGYDVYGVDGSQTAIEAARKMQKGADKSATYRALETEFGRGRETFVENDFFKDDFLETTGGGNFDLIFDYTFLCALPPPLRPSWAKRMSALLAPGGHLICLEWPLHKPPREGGPPHGLSAELYETLLRRPGQEVQYDESGKIATNDAELAGNALVCAKRYRPERTHEAGKDSDYVSLWQHTNSS
ncbi:putative thiol methyltransferase 2 [Cercospora beticola]|nr:putative thiol methyltransferase 2 [Cercospora beticola]PIB02839.1 putative thiol methyltransferase 2 [Cercospora beticola]